MFEIIILLLEFGACLVDRFVSLVTTYEKRRARKMMMMQHPGLWGMDDYTSKVHEFLETESRHDSVFGLWGISGVGKTRLLLLISACYAN
jgi:hypothetical protein